MTTRFYTHADCLEHVTPPGHPERPDRIRAVWQALSDDAFATLDRHDAPLADPELFALAHPRPYLEALARVMPETGLVRIDADTTASPGTYAAMRRATGAATSAVDAVFAGLARNAFCAVRPPGHHAETATAMGFCFVNTIAIAARHAQRAHGAERVAIVDFDVHHGNGTQDIFWSDPSVLFASTHQMPLFPGTGATGETGAGNIVNAPLSDGDGTEAFREAFESRVLPRVEAHRPDLILVSAGFDAHWRDPLAGLNLTEDDFDWATGRLMDLADRHSQGRLVSLLEGGYDLTGLAGSAAAHVQRLMRG